ncbi:MAG: TonB-dependent receptor [Gammaproteobacteria bacterium]
MHNKQARTSKGFRLLLPAVGVAMLAAAAARAQSPPVDADAIQEIVVTAEKRSESLQSVPVSVTALTRAQLGQLKIDTPSDLVTQVPNLQVNGIVGEGSPLFSLRGVSMFDYSLNQSSPVASYIDEVYKGNFTLFGVELYDLERVEVLRGPQGTLYGKNTTGGAINFITRKPGFDTEGDIKIGVGNYNRREVEGAFQTGLIPERLAVRFAFTYTKVDGFIQNVLPGAPDLEGVDQYGVRLSLLFKASDDLEFTLRASKSMQDPQNYAIVDGRVGASSPGNPGGVGFTGYFRTQDGTESGVPLTNYQVAQNYTPRRRQDNEAVELTGEWAVSPTNKMTSITSWDQGALFNPEGTDGAPYGVWKIPYTGKTRQVTQDLRLTSTGDAPFRYIVGAYYQHEIIFNSTENRIFTDPAFNTFNDYRDCAANSFAPGAGYNAGVNINLGCDYYNSFDQIRNSWAAYTDDSYKIADRITLRGGLRYNHDNGAQKNALDQLRGSDQVPIANLGFFSQQPNGTFGPTLVLPGSPGYDAAVNQTRSQYLHNTAVTGRAGVDFSLTSDALLYFNYSKGYRSAAFNAQFLFTPDDLTTVKPETLDSYEVGFKTSWLDHRLQVDGAVFHYQYKDQQIINVYPTGQQPLINLGKSKIDGGELEIVTRPMRVLTLRASVGFLHSEVQQGVLSTGSIDGQQLPYAPHVSGTLAADWEAWHTDAVKINLHLDTNYNSKQYLALPNEDAISQGGYSLLNGRLSLVSADDKWDVGVWGRNIANKFYLTNAVDVQGFGFDYRHVGTPRMYGFDAHYHF